MCSVGTYGKPFFCAQIHSLDIHLVYVVHGMKCIFNKISYSKPSFLCVAMSPRLIACMHALVLIKESYNDLHVNAC